MTKTVSSFVILFQLAFLSSALCKEAQPTKTCHPVLEALNEKRPVLPIVKKYYPDSTSLLSGNNFCFEDSTQLYVAKAIAKVPIGQEPPLVEVRGPKQKGGVWCDIWLRKGNSDSYARAEGALEREHFVEHILYQDIRGADCHLRVTLRVPKGDGSANFVRDFTALIRSYGNKNFVTDK